MFAALTVARLREAVVAAGPSVQGARSWVSPDDVAATDLPLAQATSKVLSSMHSVLEKTMEARDAELARTPLLQNGNSSPEDQQKQEHLRLTKAGEVRLVRNVRFLLQPLAQFSPQEWVKADLPESLR